MHLQAQVDYITTIAGTDSAGFSGDGGPATNARFNYPLELCLDKNGNLLVSDILNNRIRRIDISTGIITTIAGGDTSGYFGDGGPATNALLWEPQGVCIDDSDNVYIGDAGNLRIRKITAATGIINTIAGNGNYADSGDNVMATDAAIMYPWGLYIDKSQNLIFSDIGTNKIRKVNVSGIITTVAGNGSSGYAGDNGLATNAELFVPSGVAEDSLGNIIFCDAYNSVIRKIDAVTGIITTIAGNGTSGYSGNGGPATNALMNEPGGIFIDKNQDIYFADYPNGVVREIDAATGIINAVAGCGVEGFAGDGGPATNAELIPVDVSIDDLGTMYIADLNNYRVRMVYNPKLAVNNVRMSQANVTIYPNPVRDNFTIEGAKGSELSIYNLFGQEVYKGTINSEEDIVQTGQLIPGMYYVQVVYASEYIVNKRFEVVR